MKKLTKALLMAVAIPVVALAQSARPVAIEEESCFGKIHLDRAVYSIADPLGVQAIHDLEGEVFGLKKFWARGEGSNSIVSVQSDYVPPVFMWNGSGAEYTQYSSNLAFSAYAYAEGWGNRVGLKGYRYMNSGTVSNSLTFTTTPTGWEVGDVLSIINNKKYPDCVTISSIDGNVVKFNKNLPFTSIVAESQWDSKTAYVIAKPDVGNIDLGVSAHASGTMNKALNLFAYAEGFGNESLGQYSHTEGRNNVAYYASHAEGRENEASGEQSHAEGKLTHATNHRAHSEGFKTNANGMDSHAEGNSTVASGDYSHTEGLETKAIKICTHAEGYKSSAEQSGSHVEGGYFISEANNIVGGRTTGAAYGAHAEGLQTVANGSIGGHTEGCGSKVFGNGAHAEGGYWVNSGDTNWYVFGGTEARGKSSHAEGINTVSKGDASHSEGQSDNLWDYNASITLDALIGIWNTNKFSVAFGTGSHVEGRNGVAFGNYSHTEGSGTMANYESTHAEGYGTKADSNYSHAEGYNTTAGNGTKNGGWCSHSEGNTTTASGQNAHAEGNNTVASGNNSHAEGSLTIASGTSSHAEGSGVSSKKLRAEGSYSHAEGACTYAKGDASHAEGYNTQAFGGNSHAEGADTLTTNNQEHAQGRFNVTHKANTIWGNPGNTLHSIGIGTSDTARTNAVEVM